MAEARFEVRLTDEVEGDLEALYNYLAEYRSPDEADALIEALLHKVGTQRSPLRGAVPKELAPLGVEDFRQTLHPPYRIIYRVIGKTVFVTLIADGRRDMQTLLARRLLGG